MPGNQGGMPGNQGGMSANQPPRSWERPLAGVREISTAGELAEALASAGGRRVVLDCGASWCGPCKAIAPVFKRLAAAHAATVVALTMDVEEAAELAAMLSVTSMPTFFVFLDGEVVRQFSGAKPDELLAAFSEDLSR
jgi:thioredoxin 1